LTFDQFKKTAFIRLWALFNVPMIAWLRPRVIEISGDKVEIALPLFRRSKNHLNSMYFGTLAAGADLAAGVVAVSEIQKSSSKFTFAFKSLKADFLKRAEAQTHFVCSTPKLVADLVKKAEASGTREELAIDITAYTPKLLGDEPVAKFTLVLSVKKK
jgi:acyl-coenzyme A thioesterase PaaI-like protein